MIFFKAWVFVKQNKKKQKVWLINKQIIHSIQSISQLSPKSPTCFYVWLVLGWNKSLDIEPYFWIIRLIPKMWYMLFSNRKIFYQLQWELIVIALVLWEMDNFTCLITITRFFTVLLCTCNLVNVAIEILSHKATENINHDHIKLLTMY
jgi:hypothetical protein